MLLKLRNFVTRFFRRGSINHINESLEVGQGSIVSSLSIDLRQPEKGKKYVFVGSDSIVESKFVFDRRSGSVSVGNNTYIGSSTFICINEIEIGNDVLISWNCLFIDNVTHSTSWRDRKRDVLDWKKGIKEGFPGKYKNWENISSSKITVKNKAWIGYGCIILKGVTIGEGAIVGAGSVVTKDIPDWTVYGGNPAKFIKDVPLEERD